MLALTNALIFAFLGLTWSLPTAYPEPEPYPADLNTLEARQSLNPTRNELSGSCKPVTIIFARGTAEPGNVGLLAGPPWFNVLGAIIGYNNIAVQGVNYDASIPNYLLGGSAAGSKTLASLVGQAASKCPQTQIVVGGYRLVTSSLPAPLPFAGGPPASHNIDRLLTQSRHTVKELSWFTTASSKSLEMLRRGSMLL